MTIRICITAVLVSGAGIRSEEWSYVVGISNFLSKETNGSIAVHCILDKDYFSDLENNRKYAEAKENKINLTIWSKKELENYLIVPSVIYRIIARNSNKNQHNVNEEYVSSSLNRLIESLKMKYSIRLQMNLEEKIETNKNMGILEQETKSSRVYSGRLIKGYNGQDNVIFHHATGEIFACMFSSWVN